MLSVIFALAWPTMLEELMQTAVQYMDTAMVGTLGTQATAAVGATGTVSWLVGSTVSAVGVGFLALISQSYGAGDRERARRASAQAVIMTVIVGLLFTAITTSLSGKITQWMQVDVSIRDMASQYFFILYSPMLFRAASIIFATVLRAVGDTRRPMQFLTIAGIINVILNVITVLYFNLGVAGVAIATSVSQYISAIFVVISLVKTESCLHLDVRHMRIHRDKMLAILKVGLPAGLQSLVFSISNVVIQSSVNSFGSAVMAGSAASNNVEGFIYTSMNAVVQSAMAFTGQNIGARKFQRIGDIVRKSILLQMIIAGSMAVIGCAFSEQLISIYAKGDAESIAWGVSRLRIISGTYFIMGISDVAVGAMRGMGNSTVPMAISIFGICVLRIVWIYTVFSVYRTFEMLVVSYPISWIVTLIAQYVCYGIVKRRTIATMQSGEKSI